MTLFTSLVIVGVMAFRAVGRSKVSSMTCSCGNETRIWSEWAGGWYEAVIVVMRTSAGSVYEKQFASQGRVHSK